MMEERNLLKLPTTLKHDEHDHHCGCVKCYLTNVVSVAKIELVWLIEYILVFTIFNSESSNIKSYFFKDSFTTRSPPLL